MLLLKDFLRRSFVLPRWLRRALLCGPWLTGERAQHLLRLFIAGTVHCLETDFQLSDTHGGYGFIVMGLVGFY
jgi:hypothetical protein